MTSFEAAMGEGYSAKEYHNCRKLKKDYERGHFEKVEPSAQPLIPKKIHQIWIGGQVPEKFKALMQTWKDKHPDWEYKLWTDEDIKNFSFLEPETFFSVHNLGSKSDIWRYEILYQEGGVYVDIDFECIQPLDQLVHAHSFFTGVGGFDYINNAIIGSKPEASLFKKIIQLLKCTPKEKLEDPWYHTGPLLFTKQVYHYLKEFPEEGIVYPVRFFYPLPNIYRFDYWKGHLSKEWISHFFIPETFAVHYWAESWR
jgi:mannosyltransferase OCH1-like enzyme